MLRPVMLAGALLVPSVMACGASGGAGEGGESSSTGDATPTTDEPSTSGEPEPTSGLATTTDDPTSTGEPDTEGDTDTDPPLVVCEDGDVHAGFVMDVGTLPLTGLAEAGAGSRHLRAFVTCTVDATSTSHSILLSCIGSDDAAHDVAIELDAEVPVAPSLVANAEVALTYVSDGWLTTECPTGDAVEPSIWFEVRDDGGALQLGGAAGGWYTSVAPKGEDAIDWFAPNDVAVVNHCEGQPEDLLGCIVSPLALGIASPGKDAPPVLVVGSEVQVDGLSFALESGSRIYLEPEHFCCAESRETELQLLVVAIPAG